MVGVHLVVTVGLAVIVAAGGPLAAYETVNDTSSGVGSPTDDFESSSEPSDVAGDDPTAEVVESIDRGAVREQFRQLLNEERRSRGLQTLSQRSVLREMGQSYAETMATHDYFGHESPSGKTIEDRYRERGLLPECRLPKSGSTRYYPGAENVAQTWVNQQLVVTNGPSEILTNEDLARALFEMWMHSPGHREAMLVSSADEMGLGIKIRDDEKVFAALELC